MKTFGLAYSLLFSTHPIDLFEKGANFEQHAWIPGFYDMERAVISVLPERDNFSLCALCKTGKECCIDTALVLLLAVGFSLLTGV